MYAEEFWSKVIKTNDHWIWQGAKSANKKGDKFYGIVVTEHGKIGAHVYSVLLSGAEIPKYHDVHHKCDNTLCVNPAHLEVIHEMFHKGHYNKDKTHCKRGHEYTPENTRKWIGENGTHHRTCIICDREKAARRNRLIKEGII